jgi:endonuclease YncB( thermonuclease family)
VSKQRKGINVPLRGRDGSGMGKFRARVTLLLLLLLPVLGAAETLSGRVVRVVDGDTVYVLDASKERHKIRFAGIDAPERGQPFGKKSKQRMSELVAGRDARVDWYKKDRWGRLIGQVWVASPDCRADPCAKTVNAGFALVTSGLAWHYKKVPYIGKGLDVAICYLLKALRNSAVLAI